MEKGNYRIVIPAGLIYFNGDRNNKNTEEYVLNFTIENDYVAPQPIDAEFTATPANNATISELSEIVYVPLIVLVNEIRNNTNRITLKEFRQCIPTQCSNIEMRDSGKILLERISSNFRTLITSDILSSYDLDAEKTEYESIGLNKSNAYLHIRGHEIYDLVKYIGTRHCPDKNIRFKDHILDSLNIEFAYQEMSLLVKDLKCL